MNCNLTVNKTHVILSSHMFTVHAGTSGYLPSSKISSFLDGFTFPQGQTFSGPHQACSPSPSFRSSPPGRRTDVSWDTRYGGNSQEMISHVTTCSLAEALNQRHFRIRALAWSTQDRSIFDRVDITKNQINCLIYPLHQLQFSALLALL